MPRLRHRPLAARPPGSHRPLRLSSNIICAVNAWIPRILRRIRAPISRSLVTACGVLGSVLKPPGRIINLGDSACDRLEAHVLATPYHIAKLGVHVLTRSYAQLLMPKGITVNMISPGFLENSVGRPPQRLPAGHPGSFNDILGALDYLLSEQASYVSGTNLLVTGAWNLG